ncbi:unnamed protein product, partial [Amoebophrya sp. A25]|eukprot:GSA25T00022290001.1
MSSYTRSELGSVGQLGGGAGWTKPTNMGQTHLPTDRCRMHTTAILTGIAWALGIRRAKDGGKYKGKALELEIG